MGNTTLTHDDVKRAMTTLRKQGNMDPGVHLIRQHLGRGSVTTISRLKKELAQMDLRETKPGTTTPITDPLTALISNIWESLYADMEIYEAELEKNSAKSVAVLQSTLDQTNKDLAAVQQLVAERAITITARETALEESRAQCNALSVDLAAATTTIDHLGKEVTAGGEQRIKDAAACETALKEKRESLKAAGDRNYELNDQIIKLNTAIAHLEDTVATRDSEIGTLGETLQRTAAELVGLKDDYASASRQHQEDDKRIDRLEQSTKTLDGSLTELRERLTEKQAEVEWLKGSIASKDREITSMSTLYEAAATRDRQEIARLTELAERAPGSKMWP
ncbi:MAG: DNA-binding protein [Gammaproteobacteria bacterium]